MPKMTFLRVEGRHLSRGGGLARVRTRRTPSLPLIPAAATSLLASDAKYRKFASMVDKSLQVFESVNEWADFISFLSRLLKVSRL